jgi:hypothetical protein
MSRSPLDLPEAFAELRGLDWKAILNDVETLDERQAIIDAEHGSETHRPHRTYSEIYALEDRAEAVLAGPERFPGQHWCARTLIEKDVPRWRENARSVASGLGVK